MTSISIEKILGMNCKILDLKKSWKEINICIFCVSFIYRRMSLVSLLKLFLEKKSSIIRKHLFYQLVL